MASRACDHWESEGRRALGLLTSQLFHSVREPVSKHKMGTINKDT